MSRKLRIVLTGTVIALAALTTAGGSAAPARAGISALPAD